MFLWIDKRIALWSLVIVWTVIAIEGQPTYSEDGVCGKDDLIQRQLEEIKNILREQSLVINKLILAMGRESANTQPYILAGFWPFTNEHQGEDLSGHGNHFELVNVAFQPGCESSNCSDVARFSSLSGASYATITPPSKQLLGPMNDITWTAWVYPETSSSGPLFEYYDNRVPYFQIWIYGSGKLFLNPAAGKLHFSQLGPVVKMWNRLAVSVKFETNQVVFFANGQREEINLPVSGTKLNSKIVVGRRRVYNDPGQLNAKVTCMKLYNGVADVALVEIDEPQCPQVW